jgi:YidC/Oxa1 family membrane protein insertase
MNNYHTPDPADIKRLSIAVLLMSIGLLAWQYFYELPRQQQEYARLAKQQERQQVQQKAIEKQMQVAEKEKEAVAELPKVQIESPEVSGFISLRGARISSLILNHYRQELPKDSPPVELLKPSSDPQAYFVEFGWVSQDGSVKVPNGQSDWQADRELLSKDAPLRLTWDNGEGVRFEIDYALKGPYLFDVTQRVINNSGKPVQLLPYGYVNRTLDATKLQSNVILHEGPIGALGGELQEVNYKQLVEDGDKRFDNTNGWLGITDKYWLTALVPQVTQPFTTNFKHYTSKEGLSRYQADFLMPVQDIASGGSETHDTLLFAGAKQLALLEQYGREYNIPLFDRAVDFGVLYFLTKPLLKLLSFLYEISGNFGVAILMLTIVVKLAMYPLANKSYIAMNEMKNLQPQILKLKERYGDDKMKFQQEMMAIYRKEKINPAAGCLPMLIQIPVFFALYKVLFVSLEMRHAPFVGFVKDLSAKDPTNIFTLFGLLDWNPPGILHLGILAIAMAASMWLLQRMSPQPTDPVQAKVMDWLPWIMMLVMASFPAGLLIYWTWSNTLSILQQWSIKKRYEKRKEKRAASLAANDA